MKTIVTATLIALTSTPLAAGSWETQCGVKSVPYQAKVKGAKPEEILGGVIIGGVIGNATIGNNGGTAIGAIIGGAIANENGKKSVTKYKNVKTCKQVFIPERISDQGALRAVILRLNSGDSESKERIMDVQFTIGASQDGVWGPRSVLASNEYLAGNYATDITDEAQNPLYSLIVNDVVVVSSLDVNAVDEIQKALLEAGVESQIFVNLE
jgi:outer membrane lipoprotein SlyB